MARPHAPKRFTGKHMSAILVGGFGVVIAVNFTMATLANTTFGGVVVENSYVASQEFNGWLDKAERSRALGWKAQAVRRPDGRVAIALEGVPSFPTVTATARHPLGRLPDIALSFQSDGDGNVVSRETLPAGRWDIRIAIEAGGHAWRGEEPLG
ncbi:FixH family protein [Novosphingobium sp. PC22D]|uniref:FixH family protein n=1 Tax=Novosphingobium sp. PC22D TaxID=1962403 RepID=UPI0026C0B274